MAGRPKDKNSLARKEAEIRSWMRRRLDEAKEDIGNSMEGAPD